MAEEQKQEKPPEQKSAGGGAVKPIVIKRVRKGGHGHHGGAWKLAYADFMTAMFAFFLLMWLVGSATEEQLAGIAEFFSPTSASTNTSGSGGIMGGKVIGQGSRPSSTGAQSPNVPVPPSAAPLSEGGGDAYRKTSSQEDAEQARYEAEQADFEAAKQQVIEAMEGRENMKTLLDNLVIEFTPEGMVIQLIDKNHFSMFASGSFVMLPKAKELLGVVTKVVGGMPQKIAITGHTDATPYHNADGYSNWELSADRALASRREMLGFGLDPARVIRVAGMAAADPFVRDNPYDPSNRRISIVLLREYRPVRPPAVVQPESLDIGPPAPSKRVRDRFRNPFVRD